MNVKKPTVGIASLIAISLAAAGIGMLLTGEPQFTDEQVSMVEEGMTETEIAELLGAPGKDRKRPLPPFDLPIVPEEAYEKVWKDNCHSIVVSFDQQEKALIVNAETFLPRDSGLIQRLLNRLSVIISR
jgi:hypothetical protein